MSMLSPDSSAHSSVHLAESAYEMARCFGKMLASLGSPTNYLHRARRTIEAFFQEANQVASSSPSISRLNCRHLALHALAEARAEAPQNTQGSHQDPSKELRALAALFEIMMGDLSKEKQGRVLLTDEQFEDILFLPFFLTKLAELAEEEVPEVPIVSHHLTIN